MKPTLKPPGTERLKLKYDEAPSTFAFKFNLRRYNLGTPLRTARFNLLGSCDDLDIQLAAIRLAHPGAPIFGYGESAGTGLAVRYSGEKRHENPFEAIVCVCPGYDTTEAGAYTRPLFSST